MRLAAYRRHGLMTCDMHPASVGRKRVWRCVDGAVCRGGLQIPVRRHPANEPAGAFLDYTLSCALRVHTEIWDRLLQEYFAAQAAAQQPAEAAAVAAPVEAVAEAVETK
ncbi:MAG TPA: hypothetical protein VL522_23530 [Bordetella sp.]|nr:hypothetical protein [Bordetella sp.]